MNTKDKIQQEQPNEGLRSYNTSGVKKSITLAHPRGEESRGVSRARGALSSGRAHYNEPNNILLAPKGSFIHCQRKTWLKAIALIVIAAFLWQNAACAYSYKGEPIVLKEIFEYESASHTWRSMYKTAAASAIGAAAGAAGGAAAGAIGGYAGATAGSFTQIGINTACYSAAGALSSYVNSKYVYKQDRDQVRTATYVGALSGGISGGVSSINSWSGGTGAFWGGVIGGAVGTGAGYLLEDGDKSGAWAYGLQGAIAGASAGAMGGGESTETSEPKTTGDGSSDSGFGYKSDGSMAGDITAEGYMGGGTTSGADATGTTGPADHYGLNTWNAKTQTMSNYSFNTSNNTSNYATHCQSTWGNTTTTTSGQTSSDPSYFGYKSDGSMAGDITEGYMGGGTTSGADATGTTGPADHYGLNTWNAKTQTMSNYSFNTSNNTSNYATHCQSTWGNTTTTTAPGFWGKAWKGIKNSPEIREFIVGFGTAVVTHDLNEAIAGDIYLDTYDSETGEWDQEKAEFWTTVATGTLAGILNAPATLGGDISSQSEKSWTGALAAIGKGMAVGTLSGLGSAYAVKTARHHLVDDEDDKDEIERFETLKPAIQQLGGVVGMGLGRGVVDLASYKAKPKNPLYKLEGGEVGIYDEHPEGELTLLRRDGTSETIYMQPGESLDDYAYANLMPEGDLYNEEKAIEIAQELASDRKLAASTLVPIDAKTLQEVTAGREKMTIDTVLAPGYYRLKGFDEVPFAVHISEEQAGKGVTFRSLIEGGPERSQAWVDALIEIPLAEAETFDIASKTKTTHANLDAGEVDWAATKTRTINGKEYLDVRLNERASAGRIALNILSSTGKAIAADYPYILGTLAQSSAGHWMRGKAERSGNENWQKYALLTGEAAGYITTALGRELGSAAGAIYRDPLDKLEYNMDIKKKLGEKAMAKDKGESFDNLVDRTLGMSDADYKKYKQSDTFWEDIENSARKEDLFDDIRDEIFHMSDQEYKDYKESGVLSADAETIEFAKPLSQYCKTIENMSPDDAMAALDINKWGFHGKRAGSSILRDSLAKTLAGAATLNLDEFMTKRANKYWGGEGSTSAADFDTAKEYNEWKAGQALNRAYALNTASAFFRGAALWAGTKWDKEIQTKQVPIRDDQVEIGDWLFSADDLEKNAGATREGDILATRAREEGDTLKIFGADLEKYMKEKGYTQEQRAKVTKDWQDLQGYRSFPVEDDIVSLADGNFAAATLEQIEGIECKDNNLIIPFDVLKDPQHRDKFARQWALEDKPAGLGESIVMAVGSSHLGAIREGLSFAYNDIDYTPFGWTQYLSNLQQVSGAFSSRAAMRGYWANVYREGAKNNLAGIPATIEPVADFFGSMPERAIIKKFDPKHPEEVRYRIYFKNITNLKDSYGVKGWYYQGPYPKKALIDRDVEQDTIKGRLEPVDLSLSPSGTGDTTLQQGPTEGLLDRQLDGQTAETLGGVLEIEDSSDWELKDEFKEDEALIVEVLGGSPPWQGALTTDGMPSEERRLTGQEQKEYENVLNKVKALQGQEGPPTLSEKTLGIPVIVTPDFSISR